jgi:4,5-DOPA dioxygenase extradiol
LAARTWPALFISHGAPTLVLEEIPARHFLASLGKRLGRPDAVLCVSAHWQARFASVGGAERPETIHDFHGFPAALYRLRYTAPGAPAFARRVADLCTMAGIACAVDPLRGLDHGAWNPLLLLYPDADVPVTQLSILAEGGPAAHRALGRAISSLRRENVLVLASGGAVHNLRQFQIDRDRPAPWAEAFEGWLVERVAAGDEAALLAYRETRPEAKIAHPTDDHILPLFVALGAGAGDPAQALHRSFAHGSLSMAAFAWGEVPAAA